MSAHVGTAIFDDWHSLPMLGGWTDTFTFTMSADAGLPPADYARLLRRMVPVVMRLRRSASLWVRISAAPGNWYGNVVRQTLYGIPLPYAVTQADCQQPAAADFSFRPWTDVIPSPPPPKADFTREIGLSAQETSVLRVLARLTDGYTAEIASLAGIERNTARSVLRTLYQQKLIEPVKDSDYPRWSATRKGISLALRSWGVPPQLPFTARRENRLGTGSEHQRPARLWLAWLRQAWRHADVWAGWSELAVNRSLRPDALAWGKLHGYETLFWLEVETGHQSREQIRAKILRRFREAAVYVHKQKVRLVFCVLAPHWVREAVSTIFSNIAADTAVVIGDWKSFGDLPLAGFGEMGLTGQLTAPRYLQRRTKAGIERKWAK